MYSASLLMIGLDDPGEQLNYEFKIHSSVCNALAQLRKGFLASHPCLA